METMSLDYFSIYHPNTNQLYKVIMKVGVNKLLLFFLYLEIIYTFCRSLTLNSESLTGTKIIGLLKFIWSIVLPRSALVRFITKRKQKPSSHKSS